MLARAWLKSVLPVRRKACDMVSMFRSPPPMLCSADMGLPSGCRTGDILKPLIEPVLLFGGEVSAPCDETGDRIGEGDRLPPSEANDVKPAIWIDSRLPGSPPRPPCSA